MTLNESAMGGADFLAAQAGPWRCAVSTVAGARVIGRSESLPILYLRCSDCGRTSVMPE